MSLGPTVIVLTPEALASLVKTAVCEAFIEHQSEVAQALLDRSGAARVLGVGTSTIDRLRREGLPCILIGDSPRFEASACIEWLRQRHGEPGAGAAADAAGVSATNDPCF
jgi:hypothetical protein